MDDTLAPGAQLGFGDEQSTLAEQGPRSDEFFFDAGMSVPVSRSTTRVPPAPAPPSASRGRTGKAGKKESRGARRRRLGIPRRVTPRVIGFILLIAAVPVAAYFVLRWYAYDNWVVTLQGDQIVVKQGQPGGVLWFHPRVVDRSRYTTSMINPVAVGPHPGRGPGVLVEGRPELHHQRDDHDDHHDHDDDHDDDARRVARAPRRHHDAPAPSTTTTGSAMTGAAVPRRRRHRA